MIHWDDKPRADDVPAADAGAMAEVVAPQLARSADVGDD